MQRHPVDRFLPTRPVRAGAVRAADHADGAVPAPHQVTLARPEPVDADEVAAHVQRRLLDQRAAAVGVAERVLRRAAPVHLRRGRRRGGPDRRRRDRRGRPARRRARPGGPAGRA
ncbi:hypothetical protein DKL51_28935, partial [Micromonospora globispora]